MKTPDNKASEAAGNAVSEINVVHGGPVNLVVHPTNGSTPWRRRFAAISQYFSSISIPTARRPAPPAHRFGCAGWLFHRFLLP
jgi:hypothetical protein